MIYRVRDSEAVSAWISDDRGRHTHGGESVCPGFHRYKGFAGCPAWAAGQECAYCFLRATHRFDRELSEGVVWGRLLADCEDCHRQEDDASCRAPECRVPIDVSPARAAVAKWLQRPASCATCSRLCLGRQSVLKEALACDKWLPMVLNCGELADSFGFSPKENPHVGMLLYLFSDFETNPHGHKVLFVTKAGLEATKAHLGGRKASDNVILSWSMGDSPDEEPYWLDLWSNTGRFCGMAWASRQGWRVRVRLDPLLGRDELSLYKHAANIASAAPCALPNVECWTLGCRRYRGGRQAESEEYRMWAYRQVIEGIRWWQGRRGVESTIALCKETPAMIREVLGIEPGEMRCNCVA